MVSEAAILAIASLPAVWEIHTTASNGVLSLAFALSICSASVLSIVFFQEEREDEGPTGSSNVGAMGHAAAQGIEVDVEPPASVTDRPAVADPFTTEARDFLFGDDGASTSTDTNGMPLRENNPELLVNVDVAGTTTLGNPSARAPENNQQPTPPPTRRTRQYRRGGEVLYIAEGVAQAAVGLVRDPVRGAQVDGARGLVKGIGSGVLGVVGRPARGVARAGANAYTGMRIGASRAGRAVGSVRAGGGGGGGGRSSVKV